MTETIEQVQRITDAVSISWEERQTLVRLPEREILDERYSPPVPTARPARVETDLGRDRPVARDASGIARQPRRA